MNLGEIGLIIKDRRRQLNINQQDLADLAEVNINPIVSVERGKGNPKLDTIIILCKVLVLEISIN